MIGLLSSPSAVSAVDEAAARRAASPLEAKADPTPIDAVHAVEPATNSGETAAHAHQHQELTTEERLRQDEALHPTEPDADEASEAADEQSVKALQARDAEVRQHEQAHRAAAGGLASAPSYRFERGPDGRSYAVDGEVSIDTSSESNPDATIEKMRQVRRAALAPAEPSSQDHSVAAKAARVIRAAEAELAARRAETLREAAQTLAEVREASITDENARGGAGLGDAPPPAAHQVSEYQRQAVLSAGARLSSIPPPPSGFDTSV